LHHGFFTIDTIVFINTVFKVLIGDDASLTRRAVSAHFHGRAFTTVIVTSSEVDRASLISDVVLVDPIVSKDWKTTMATHIRLLARDENLRGDVDIGPGSISLDLDSIGQGRGGSMSPAGTAVRGNVLLSNVSQIVNTVDIVPDPLLWQVLNRGERLSNIAGVVPGLTESLGNSVARSLRVDVTKSLGSFDFFVGYNSSENQS
jgi:hypothetical protein